MSLALTTAAVTLEIEPLEARTEMDFHGSCFCTSSCGCSSCSCVVWW